MKKALLIGYYFQQTVSIGSVRAWGLAKYLVDFGWDITILSGTTGDDEGFDVVEVMVDDVVTKWSKILKLDQGILPNVQMGAPVHRNRKSIYGNLISLGGIMRLSGREPDLDKARDCERTGTAPQRGI